MKKLLVLGIVAALAISMTACAGNTQTTTSSSAAASLTTAATTAPTEAETTAKAAAASGEEVELILPALLFSVATEEDLQLMVETQGYISAKKNEDGSVTVKMTAEVHKEVIEKMKQGLEEQLSTDALSESAPYVTAVEFNDDLTTVTIKVNKAEYEAAIASGDEAAVFTVALTIANIQPFMGKDLISEISVIDESTSEVIKTYIIPRDTEILLEEYMAALMAGIGETTAASTSAS